MVSGCVFRLNVRVKEIPSFLSVAEENRPVDVL